VALAGREAIGDSITAAVVKTNKNRVVNDLLRDFILTSFQTRAFIIYFDNENSSLLGSYLIIIPNLQLNQINRIISASF
jgi:hypothetical protein